MKDRDGKSVLDAKPENAYSILIFSSPDLKAGNYTLWSNEQQLAGSSGGMMGGSGMGPGEMARPEDPENMQPPEGFTPPQGDEGSNRPEKPEGNRPGNAGGNPVGAQEMTTDFVIRDGGNMFSGISQNDEQ